MYFIASYIDNRHWEVFYNYCNSSRVLFFPSSSFFNLFFSRWRRQWHPTPVLLPGTSCGWRRLVGCSPWGREESDTTERLRFHFSLSCIGEGNGNLLQCSCLENPRDRGDWWAAVYGVTQSWTRLKWLSRSSSSRPYHCLVFSCLGLCVLTILLFFLWAPHEQTSFLSCASSKPKCSFWYIVDRSLSLGIECFYSCKARNHGKFKGPERFSVCWQSPGLLMWNSGWIFTCVCVLSHFSCVWLFATLWTVAGQAPLSLRFPRQEYWSGLPWPPPGDLPNPGTELVSLQFSSVAQSCLTFCDPMNCFTLGFPVHHQLPGVSVSCIGRRVLYH